MRLALTLACLAALPATAQECGGSFATFIDGLKSEAIAQGRAPATVEAFFRTIRQDAAVLRRDQAQGFFQKDFLEFSRAVISANRLQTGARMSDRFDTVFDRIQAEYGVPRGVLLAFWALETDYGQVQGDFNTANALVTLAHDCRRPELFRPQVLAAIELYEQGGFDPATTTGAWAGEIGQVQMLPADILENGRDGDGDGRVSLKSSSPDALVSGAAMLVDLGWRPNEPWLQEITLPADFPWERSGLTTRQSVADWQAIGVRARTGSLGAADLPAAVILPMGRRGPAFLAYPNFDVYFEWNQSFTYVTTAAYMATRLSGAPVYDAGDPAPGLTGLQMEELQRKLQAMGYDTGGVDGILGARTRAAVQDVQSRLGLPADAWPTPELLARL